MKTFTLLSAVLLSTVAAAEPQLVEPIDLSPTDPGPQKLGVFLGVGYLGSVGASGSAANAGVRLSMGGHVALGFDLGWGLTAAANIVHDRWWLMPTVAFTIPVGRVRFDLGAGVGLGTSSGYSDVEEFAAAPFMPDWAFQLVPAVRGHALASMQLNSKFDVFARLDVGSLLLEGNTIGFRDNNPRPGVLDTFWLNLSVGVSFRLL